MQSLKKRLSIVGVAIISMLSMLVVGLGMAVPASATVPYTMCVPDVLTYSYKVCITQNYNLAVSGGVTYIQVPSYDVVYSALSGGNQGVSLHSGVVTIGASGRTLYNASGGYFGPQATTYKISVIQLGHAYVYTPSWSADWIEVQAGLSYQCGIADATETHGGTSWDLNPQGLDVCQGSPVVGSIWT